MERKPDDYKFYFLPSPLIICLNFNNMSTFHQIKCAISTNMVFSQIVISV